MANQFQPLLDGIESGLKSLLNEILDEGVSDLEGPIREISQRLTVAARRNRPDLVAMCKDQLALVVLERELQVRQGLGSFWEGLLATGIDILISGAVGGLGSLRR